MAYRPETVSFIFSRQPNNSLIAVSINRMLTVFPKTCFRRPFVRTLFVSRILPVNPHKYAVFDGFQRTKKHPKGIRKHSVPTTRNQFDGNVTRVRIPSSPPRKAGAARRAVPAFSFAIAPPNKPCQVQAA